ncbi:hypothetical protein SH2C18_03770 [Clostridium sediminicola]
MKVTNLLYTCYSLHNISKKQLNTWESYKKFIDLTKNRAYNIVYIYILGSGDIK